MSYIALFGMSVISIILTLQISFVCKFLMKFDEEHFTSSRCVSRIKPWGRNLRILKRVQKISIKTLYFYITKLASTFYT